MKNSIWVKSLLFVLLIVVIILTGMYLRKKGIIEGLGFVNKHTTPSATHNNSKNKKEGYDNMDEEEDIQENMDNEDVDEELNTYA